jgi:hypothetical protein
MMVLSEKCRRISALLQPDVLLQVKGATLSQEAARPLIYCLPVLLLSAFYTVPASRSQAEAALLSKPVIYAKRFVLVSQVFLKNVL